MPRVLVRVGRTDTLRDHFLQDLAEGGLFIRTERLLPVGAELDVSLTVPGEAQPLELHGRVVRIVTPEEGDASAAGMGIRFEKLTPRSRERLLLLLAQHTVTPAFETEIERLRAQVRALVAELSVDPQPAVSNGKRESPEEMLFRERDSVRMRCVALEADLTSFRRAVEGLTRSLQEEATERARLESAFREARRELERLRGEGVEVDVDDESWAEVISGDDPLPFSSRTPTSIDVDLSDDDTWVEVFLATDPEPEVATDPLTPRVPLSALLMPPPMPPRLPNEAPAAKPGGATFVPPEDSSGPRPLRPEDWQEAVTFLAGHTPAPLGPQDMLPFDPGSKWQDALPLEIESDSPDDGLALKTPAPPSPLVEKIPWRVPAGVPIELPVVELSPEAAASLLPKPPRAPTASAQAPRVASSQPPSARSASPPSAQVPSTQSPGPRASAGTDPGIPFAATVSQSSPPPVTPVSASPAQRPAPPAPLQPARPGPQAAPRVSDFAEFWKRLQAGGRLVRTAKFHNYTPNDPIVLAVMGWLESVETLPKLCQLGRGRIAEEQVARAAFDLYGRGAVELAP